MDDIAKLCVGDVSPNGIVSIIDEDRLCYVVLNNSKGASGIRTISKSILNEFIDYISSRGDKPMSIDWRMHHDILPQFVKIG